MWIFFIESQQLNLRKLIRSLEVSGNRVEKKKNIERESEKLVQNSAARTTRLWNDKLPAFEIFKLSRCTAIVASGVCSFSSVRFFRFLTVHPFFCPFHNSKAFRRNSSKKVIVQLLFFGRVKEFLGSNKVWCRVCWIMQLRKTEEKQKFHHHHHWTIRAPSVQKFDGLCRRGQVVGRLNIFRCWIIHESQRKVIITQLRDGIRRGNTNIHRRLYEIVTGHSIWWLLDFFRLPLNLFSLKYVWYVNRFLRFEEPKKNFHIIVCPPAKPRV